MRARHSTLLLLLVACVPEPGRLPNYPDADPLDAGQMDGFEIRDVRYDPPDTGPVDSAIGLRDTGPPVSYPFTGVFVMNGSSEKLYAREVSGRLSLIVGSSPNEYIGLIDQNGNVRLGSEILNRTGCATSSITGVYERATAFYTLQRTGCDGSGQPFNQDLRGNLVPDPRDDYESAYSGVYQLELTVMFNPGGCFEGPMGPYTKRYGLSILPGATGVVVFTGEDIIGHPVNYIGVIDTQNLSIFANHRPFGAPNANVDVALTGQIAQFDPMGVPQFSGQQDVYDFDKQCGFSLVFSGERVDRP